MGSPAFPLTVEEFVKRQKPDDGPQELVSNDSRLMTLRVDLLAGGECFASVLILPRGAVSVPVGEGITVRRTAGARVGVE